MGIPASTLKVGQCYLTSAGRVWRIVGLLSDGRVVYEHRPGHMHRMKKWKSGMLAAPLVETVLEREVPCNWYPEADEASL